MSPAGEGSDRNNGRLSPEERADFKRRSEEIGRKLEEARPGEKKQRAGKASDGSGGSEQVGRALRMSTELIGGIVVGTAIGWWLDTYLLPNVFGLDTWPLFFIVFFLLGSAAGTLNVVRSGLKMKTGPSDPTKGPSVPNDDDGDL
jgi:ATP synthase protein I